MNNLKFVQLEAYKPPIAVEDKRNEWVAYGQDNDFYQYLIDAYNKSTTNNAVINNIIKLVFGKGLKARDGKLKPEMYARFITIFSPKCVKKVVKDYKTLGNCAFQVLYKQGKKEIGKAQHIPVQLLRAGKCNDKGEITHYYYSDNWEDVKKYPPKEIPAFGYGSNGDLIEIYFIQNYTIGAKYYGEVDYKGGLPYCKLEEEIAEYLINEVQNGFSPTTIVNFNNGVPDEEKQELIQHKVKSTLTGSRGKKVVVAFNDDETKKTTVDSIPLDNAPEHYAYLSEECQRKIMLAHNVTSPLLFGIASTNGFSSNADELRNSYILFENMVIKPIQETIISAIDEIISFNGMALDLQFEPLQPLDAEGDLSNESQAVEMASQKCCLATDEDLTDEEFAKIEENLQGETVDDEWELVDSREYSEDNDSIEDWAMRKIKPKSNFMQKLSRVIKSSPSDNSTLDRDIFKVRYEYAEISGTDRNKSRTFCKRMMSRTENGVVYRKEDIDQASFQGVNKTFGHNGNNYSLWLYKGGKYCHHFWKENLYRLKKKTDGTFYEDRALSSSEEVDSIRGYKPNPRGLDKAKTATINQPGRGEYPS